MLNFKDMKNDKYILNEKGEPVEEPDLLTWGKWFEDSREKRRIARTNIGDYLVSTVFLGLDHSFGGDVPILFETMVFKENDGTERGHHELNDYGGRYFTREEALKAHKEICEQIKKL